MSFDYENDTLVFICQPHSRQGCGPCLQEWENKQRALYDEMRAYALELHNFVSGLQRVPVYPMIPVLAYIPVR
jgi:hypothetical protein